MKKQGKFQFFSLRKSLQKIKKNDWGSKKKQIKAIEDHGKHLFCSNEAFKKDLKGKTELFFF